MKCCKCGTELVEEWGNFQFEKDGITVTLVESPALYCDTCQESELTDDVRDLVDRLLAEKKKHPDTSPVLYIHVKQVLNTSK